MFQQMARKSILPKCSKAQIMFSEISPWKEQSN